ncbi:MAG: ATP-binding protein [Microcystaceae cyanobacterium]
MAQALSQHCQPLYISTQVERMALSHSLEEHLYSLDSLIQHLINCSQWVILQTSERKIGNCSPLSPSKNILFLQLCQEIKQFYGKLAQAPTPITFDLEKSQLSSSLQNHLKASQVKALTLFPLIDDQGSLGILCIGYPYTAASVEENKLCLLQAIAHQATLILRHSLQEKQLKEDKARETLLRTLFKIFNQEIPSPCYWQSILGAIGEYFDVEQVILLRFQEEKVIFEHEWRLNSDISPWQELSKVKASCDLKSCQYAKHSLEIKPKSSSKSQVTLSVSLKVKDHCFGRLILQSLKENRRFTSDEIYFLETIGDVIAIFGLYSSSHQELAQINQKNQAKGEFLSYMTHELRTPISGILGFARMLDRELYGNLNGKQKEYVGGIVLSGEHLLSLVNDFLDFSKLEAQKEELVWEAMVVEELCQSVLAIVQTKANEQGLDLILDIEERIDIFMADQRRIKQILLNLLSNAIKFTEKGSVTLEVKRSQDALLFSVIDTGIGIKAADTAKLFTPYEQIKSAVGQKHKGTGLGLTISRQLAQLHGGDLTVTSEEGKGSCFTLTLPQKMADG